MHLQNEIFILHSALVQHSQLVPFFSTYSVNMRVVEQQSMCNTIHIISYDDDDEKEAQQRSGEKFVIFPSFLLLFLDSTSWKKLEDIVKLPYLQKNLILHLPSRYNTKIQGKRSEKSSGILILLLFPASTLPFLWKTLNLPKMMLMKGNKNHRIFCLFCVSHLSEVQAKPQHNDDDSEDDTFVQ